jgi:hypothetical protein
MKTTACFVLFSALVATGVTTPPVVNSNQWHHVAGAFVPDDITPASAYNSTSGRLEFKGTATGYLYFYANVENPFDSGNPTWDVMPVTYLDPGADAEVRVYLYRKSLTTGAISTIGLFDSDVDGVAGGVERDIVWLDEALNFDSYSYFIMIRLWRANDAVNPEAHIVSLEVGII